MKRWYENGEQKKWREVERSLEQRRLVMPCNDGEATRRPVLEEEQKLDKRNGEREGKKTEKEREREREREREEKREKKGKKTITILYLPANEEKESAR